MEKRFLLSSSGLKNIVENEKENEFTFKFGNIKIEMKGIFAEFISPLVSRIHRSDPTANSIDIHHPNNRKFPAFEEIFNEEMIEIFKSISQGNEIKINKEQSNKLQLISILICNHELFTSIENLYLDYSKELEESKIDEYLDKLKYFGYGIKYQEINEEIELTPIIELISSNFYKIEQSKLNKLPKRILHEIISNDQLKINDEDSLFTMINEFFEGEYDNDNKDKNGKNDENDENDDLKIIDFYEELEIRGLSDEKFKMMIKNIELNEMTTVLWNKLCQRFLNTEMNEERYAKPKIQNFPFNGDEKSALRGIIRHLSEECGGNVSERGIVKVASYPEQSSNPGKNAVDLDNINSEVATDNNKDSHLLYDFKDRQVRPTHYTIRSRPYGKSNHQLQSWVIEGSNTGENDWKILDSRAQEKCLDDLSVTHTFNIQEKLDNEEYYRFLRLRMTGPDTIIYNDCYHLCLSALEYFGSMI